MDQIYIEEVERLFRCITNPNNDRYSLDQIKEAAAHDLEVVFVPRVNELLNIEKHRERVEMYEQNMIKARLMQEGDDIMIKRVKGEWYYETPDGWVKTDTLWKALRVNRTY